MNANGKNDDGPAGTMPIHPIGVVSRRTGVSLHVLRAWERRYGVVEPERTAGGQRLYSDADIERLQLLRQVTDAGRNISQVAHLPVADLQRLALDDTRQVLRAPALADDSAPAGVAAQYRARCVEAAERLDGEAVHGTLMRAVVSLRPAEFLDDVLMPLLQEVGERWHAGRLSPAQEHVVSVNARRVVTWLIDAYESPSGAPMLLVTTVAGEQHEFGALMASVIGLEAGWRVTYLGTSLPADEIVKSAQLVEASAVALSVVALSGVESAAAEVLEVRGGLPATVTVVAGGAGAESRRAVLEEAGVMVLHGAAELGELLRHHAAAGSSR
jgi:MerR family transcriptional regulator, light-induced transcriptional regulator